MRSRAAVVLDAGRCVARARALLDAVIDGEARVAAAVVRGPVTVRGSRQRAEAFAPDVVTVARATTGAAAWVGGVALWWTLALPRVDALAPDATPRTLLNRNVRGFLRGIVSLGAPASYLGRDAIALRGATVARLGYDLLDDGRVLLDVIAGWDRPVAPPGSDERSVALAQAIPARAPEEVAARVMDVLAAHAGVALAPEEDGPLDAPPGDDVPIALRGGVRVPIGRVEAGVRAGRPWLGGDLLASTAWLSRAEDALARGEALPPDAVLDGARPEDLLRAWTSADE